MRGKVFCRAFWLLFRSGKYQEKLQEQNCAGEWIKSKEGAFRHLSSSPHTINLTCHRLTHCSSKSPLPVVLPRKRRPIRPHGIIYCSSWSPVTPFPTTLGLLLFSRNCHRVSGCLLYIHTQGLLPHFLLLLQMLEVTDSRFRSCMPSIFTSYKPARRKQDDDCGPLLGTSPKSLLLDFVCSA